MSDKELSDKQLKVIELLVKGEMNIVQICDFVQVPRSTFYEWKKQKKFTDKYKEILNASDEMTMQIVKTNAKKYVNRLDQIAMQDTNINAAVKALQELREIGKFGEGEFNNDNTEDTGSKNKLKDMLFGKKNI